MKHKIAFVVQRYGAEINGGAELHCKLLAQQLTKDYEVDVLTSCALSYKDWHDHYKPGEASIEGVRVFRFPTNNRKNDRFYWIVRKKNRLRKIAIFILKTLGASSFKWGRTVIQKLRKEIFTNLIDAQGPYVPALLEFLKKAKDDYLAIFFFTYLYYPTVRGIQIAPEKSILIPTAHDEPAIKNVNFGEVFNLPATIIYNTKEEKKFVNSLFNNDSVHSTIAGVGIDIDESVAYINIPEHFEFSGDYILYVGRIDTNKGCKSLIEYFLRYKQDNESNLKLLMLGSLFMPIEQHPDILCPGFVDESIKINAIKQSLALVVPSFYESLSMVTLESMLLKTPVIVNGQCEVLKSHILQSEGGFYYNNFDEFQQAVNELRHHSGRQEIGARGQRYVQENYSWETVLGIIKKEINQLISD